MYCDIIGTCLVWRGGEWENFRDIVMECTNDVCDMRRVGGQRRKGSEWWNEEVGRAVAENRQASEECFREERG